MLRELILVLLVSVSAGAQAVVPARLLGAEAAERRRGLWLTTMLLPVYIVAGVALLAGRAEEAMGANLLPLTQSLPGRCLLLLLPMTLLAGLLTAWRAAQLPTGAVGFNAGFGLALVVVTAWTLERLREGTAGPLGGHPLLLVVAQLLFLLGAGEAVAPGRPRWSVLGAAAVGVEFLALGEPIRGALWQIGGLNAVAAAFCLAGARWLPTRLRRPSVVAGALLLAILWVESARLASGFTPPMVRAAPRSDRIAVDEHARAGEFAFDRVQHALRDLVGRREGGVPRDLEMELDETLAAAAPGLEIVHADDLWKGGDDRSDPRQLGGRQAAVGEVAESFVQDP
jgi:hypothetical protein